MNDYSRIEQVIRYLDAHHRQQPGLEQLAATVGLSGSHFHRLFRRWAGELKVSDTLDDLLTGRILPKTT